MKKLLSFLFGELSRIEAKHEPTPPIDYPKGFWDWQYYLKSKK